MSAHEATLTRICEYAGCTEEADVGSWCFFHARQAAPEAAPVEKPAATAAPTNGGTTVTARPKTKPWTREEAIEAVNAFHGRHGRLPGFADLGSKCGLPGQGPIAKLFGGMPALIAAAGFEPQRRVAPKATPKENRGSRLAEKIHKANPPAPIVANNGNTPRPLGELESLTHDEYAKIAAAEAEITALLDEARQRIEALAPPFPGSPTR